MRRHPRFAAVNLISDPIHGYLELTLPAGGQLVSTTKLTAWKPTILITGRQHANEVSSTSHILRLAELVVTDPAYRDLLRRVNIILHPVENPDGAAIAFELQKLTPTHMLHAGRYSALGMDVASQVGEADPLLPEALVRGKLWSAWLPDIYLNPHGYPSHEWVQPFAGYVPPGFRSYWSTRGWYTSVSGLRDPRYPQHAQVIDAIRESIVREINRHPQVRAMNLRHQARYRKWAFGFAPHVFNQEIYRDTAIYYSDPESGQPSGSRQASAGRFAGRGGRSAMSRWPQVTYFIGGTEAPDETAQGEWLALVTQAGFSYLMASINYLKDGRYAIERIEEEADRDRVSLTLLRVRPVLPPRGLDAVTTNGTAGRP
uniref:Peptidase M14 domain-containing protein n=1 Tax=Thermorudis sp. TaxID=1969470 RepID=A0A7C3AN39_9BACT